MIDYIKICAEISDSERESILDKTDMVGNYKTRTGEAIPRQKDRDFRNMVVTITQPKGRTFITISGSIQKFYQENNYSKFTSSMLIKAVEDVEKEFNISADRFKVVNFEASVTVEHAPVYNLFKGFDRYSSLPMVAPRSSVVYGKVADTGKKKKGGMGVKIYDKTAALKLNNKTNHHQMPDLQHLEVVVRRIDWYNNRYKSKPIKTLNDLKERETHKDLAHLIDSTSQKLLFDSNKIDFNDLQNKYNLSPHQLTTLVAMLSNKEYEDYLREAKPQTFKKHKSALSRVRTEKTTDSDLIVSFREQVSMTLETCLAN